MIYVHPENLGKIPILANIFQMGWNYQPEIKDLRNCHQDLHTVDGSEIREKKHVGWGMYKTL